METAIESNTHYITQKTMIVITYPDTNNRDQLFLFWELISSYVYDH